MDIRTNLSLTDEKCRDRGQVTVLKTIRIRVKVVLESLTCQLCDLCMLLFSVTWDLKHLPYWILLGQRLCKIPISYSIVWHINTIIVIFRCWMYIHCRTLLSIFYNCMLCSEYLCTLCFFLKLGSKVKGYRFFKDFIYLFLERGEGKEKERVRNISVWLPLTRPHLVSGPQPRNVL